MSLEQTKLEDALDKNLTALVIAKLEALADQLEVECLGNPRRKATYVVPLVKHMVENAAALQDNEQYQAYYVGGGGALPKARTTSEDKNALDAAAAAKASGKTTPAYEAMMARKLTADPPGRPTKGKKVAFASGSEGAASGPDAAPTTPKRIGNTKGSKSVDRKHSETDVDPDGTPKRTPKKGPHIKTASEHVKVLIHNLGPELEEVIVPLDKGVQREVAASGADGSVYYVKLDDVLTSMTKHEVASPLKGRNGRLKAFTPAANDQEPRKLRDLGAVDKILGGDVSRLTSLAAMNQHRVVKRPSTTGGDEFELNIFYVPNEVPAVPAPASATSGPVREQAPAPPAPAAPTKVQLDTDTEFHTALAAYLTSKDIPPWKGPTAEIMSQRLERYLHVEKAMKAVDCWRASLRNSAYDIPADFHDSAFPECWRWAGGHFTIDSIRSAVGLKHTTASNDLRCFSVPNKISEAAQKRIQPLLDWVKKPEDEALTAKFGKMSQREFNDWRRDALDGKSASTDKQKLKATGSGKAKGKAKEEKVRDKKRRRRDDDDSESDRRTKRKRFSSENLDDEDDEDEDETD